jgi:hypothetical protein
VSVLSSDYLRNFLTVNLVTQPARRRKPGEEAAHFKIDDDTGKMIIDAEPDSDAMPAKHQVNVSLDVAGSAYRESITAADGFTRGPHGRIKFNKDTKKRRRQNEDEDVDVEMADGEANAGKGKKERGKIEKKFGHEFRAKVRMVLRLFDCAFYSRMPCISYHRRPEVMSRKVALIRTRI